jgi:hypothetical protein
MGRGAQSRLTPMAHPSDAPAETLREGLAINRATRGNSHPAVLDTVAPASARDPESTRLDASEAFPESLQHRFVGVDTGAIRQFTRIVTLIE